MLQEYDDMWTWTKANPYLSNIHTSCIIHGPLKTYNLFARVYGGAKDDNPSNSKHTSTSNLQKWVNLYNLMLEPFKQNGRCVTMDSTYMSDIMAHIGLFKWDMNMTGSAQVNQSGTDAKATIAKINEKSRIYHVAAQKITLGIYSIVQQQHS